VNGRFASRLACAVVAISVVAHADSKDQARAHFERGVELFREGDFRAALIEFQRAYDASPNFKVLYNLGQTNLELQDYAGALKAFRGYLDGGGRSIPAARRAQVEADLRRLESRVAHLEVTVNVPDADITVDDVSVGRSPLRAPVLVSEGRRKIIASKAGMAPVSRVIDVAGGDNPKITLQIVEPNTPAPVVVNVPTPEKPENPQPQPLQPAPVRTTTSPSTGFWIGVGLTGAFAVATGVLGGVALGSKSTFDAKINQVGVAPTDIDSARNQTRTFAVATDISLGVTIAAAITTVVLAFTTSKKHVVEDHGPSAHLLVGPFFGVAGTL
jgi:hypothetical protein